MEKFEEMMLDEEMRGEFERRVAEEVQKARAEMEVQAKEGAQKATYVANKTYFKAMKKVGFVL